MARRPGSPVLGPAAGIPVRAAPPGALDAAGLQDPAEALAAELREQPGGRRGGNLIGQGSSSRSRYSPLQALAAFPEPGLLAAAVDVLDGYLMFHGFTTPAAVTASEALDAVTRAADGRYPVLYTDVAAATRRRPRDWQRLRRRAGQHADARIWHACGIGSWGTASRAWSLGLGVVTGRAYLTGALGLPPRE